MGSYRGEKMGKMIYNTEKIYPNKQQLVVYKQPFEVYEGEREKTKNKMNNNAMIEALYKEILLQRSLLRTKQTIRDIVLCNQFDTFCTFTFAKNRDNVDLCKARMQYWLQSQQKLHGVFEYLIVPEYHKDNQSLHFHALLLSYKGRVTEAFYQDTGKPIFTISKKRVYNLPGWSHGYSHATFIEGENSLEATAKYITKYITKDMPRFHGKKRYWCSQGLIRPEVSQNVDTMPYISSPGVQFLENDLYKIYIIEKTAGDHDDLQF